jgi:hypothetical protein
VKLIEFTAPDGEPDEINPDQVVDVKHADPGVYDPRGKTVIMLANGFRVVREDRAEVLKRLGGQ